MNEDYTIIKVDSLPIKFGKPKPIKIRDKYYAKGKLIIHTRKSKGSDNFNTVQTFLKG